MKKIIVIGGGPAGLFAAYHAARGGNHVTLLEYLPRPGRKLLASGAGKCNLTNVLSAVAMARRFPPDQQRFAKSALQAFPPERLLAFFRERGLEFKLIDDFYYFPVTERAADVLNVLIDALSAAGVETVCDTPVTAIAADNGRIVEVRSGGRSYPCDAVVAAGGGPGYPALGGHGSLYGVLEAAGHTVIPPVPALCGLTVPELAAAELAGVVLPDIRLKLDRDNVTAGTLLFTHDGISGPAVLDLSGRAARLLARSVPLTLNLNVLPEMTPEKWEAHWHAIRQTNGIKQVKTVLAGLLPRSLAEYMIASAGLEDTVVSRLDTLRRRRLTELLTAWPLTVTAADPWGKAMASSGGIARSEVEAATMRSRLFPNLFFAGEFIDVDGPCGGYNLQWAFSSGSVAGTNAAK
ncbi:MAG: NAD(P)/FAD-dependent oxidoreductase [Victivallaceae bacterium]|nr:NAD(P)/FAD-dependent oxidoreductase [Victivallaceae bacterium]